jgi:hemin uptake protein HemP
MRTAFNFGSFMRVITNNHRFEIAGKNTIDTLDENNYRSIVDLKQAPVRKDGDAAELFPLRVTSEALIGQGQVLVIVHRGREYRLRRTQNGKLILTA